MKVYIITHKNYTEISVPSIYTPLLVGADTNHVKKEYLKDNDFEGNISYKNKNYCELTGAYWIWKQSKEDIVGICHYRRFFCRNSRIFKGRTILTQKNILKILHKYDIIMPRKNNNEYNGHNAKKFFCLQHDANVWDSCKLIIKENYPEYIPDFNWFENEMTGYCYNMCIMSKEKYDKYCEWLFYILFKLESQVNISKYTDYNKRMFGFVSERLINVWIHHNHYNVKEMPVYFTEGESVIQKLIRKSGIGKQK